MKELKDLLRNHLPYQFMVEKKITDLPELSYLTVDAALVDKRTPYPLGKPFSMLHLMVLNRKK